MTIAIRWLDAEMEKNRGFGPGFHFLRHFLAFMIIFHHVRFSVAGHGFSAEIHKMHGPLPLGFMIVEFMRPGLFALVAVFFALSGFLVFGSALRSASISHFLAARAFRLFPALAVEVTLSALVLGPLVTSHLLTSYFTDPGFFRYFGNMIGEVSFTLPGVFDRNPIPNMVNANLWTLPPELWCYLTMLGAMVVGLTARPRVLAGLALAMVVGFQVLDLMNPHLLPVRFNATHFNAWFLVYMFVLGAAMFANADRVPLSGVLAALALAAYWVLMLFNMLQPVAGVFLCYVMVYLGMTGFAWFDRLLPMDLSYGAYLYGYPITQALIFYLLPHMQTLPAGARTAVILVLTVGLTAGFAAVSWIWIEKPALRLRKHVIREPRLPVPAAG